MLIHVYLDHNVWDFLLERGIDLVNELHKNQFALHLTSEAEFEITPTPENKRRYIIETIAQCGIDVRPCFGLYDEQHGLDQRVGGLDIGYLASEQEIKFRKSQCHKLGEIKKTKTRLFKNEADIAR